MADDVILNIDPSVWNVITFFALVVVLTPLLELLFHRVIESKATYDVLSGKHLSLSESNLGILSLHSSYWGPSRNKAFLLLITLPIIAADLLFEFSFSAATVDISEQRKVWLQPPHHTGFANVSRTVNFRDQSQFPLETARTCITGPGSLSRSVTAKAFSDTADYISGFEYRMTGTYVIRNSYLTSDNRTVVCSVSKTVGQASFVFPQVVKVRGGTRGEGVTARANTTDFADLRALFFREGFQYIGELNVPNSSAAVFWVGDDAVCLQPRALGLYCGATFGDVFILSNITMVEGLFSRSQRPSVPSNLNLAVILSASGSSIIGMKSRERTLRVLSSLVGTRTLTSRLRGGQPTQRLITKGSLQRIAFMIMSVANEEGIGGIREEVGVRLVKNGEKQSATMKRMAFIPIGIILFSVITLVLVDCIFGMLITRKLKGDDENGISGLVHADIRVRMSLQWFFERICDDLRASGYLWNVQPSDISAKPVVHGNEECFQLLPLSSSQY